MALCICAAFGWWGVLYPELTMTPDTYRVVTEEQGVDTSKQLEAETQGQAEAKTQGQAETKAQAEAQSQEQAEWDFDSNIYWEILQADRSQIRFRSKLLTDISHFLRK